MFLKVVSRPSDQILLVRSLGQRQEPRDSYFYFLYKIEINRKQKNVQFLNREFFSQSTCIVVPFLSI